MLGPVRSRDVALWLPGWLSWTRGQSWPFDRRKNPHEAVRPTCLAGLARWVLGLHVRRGELAQRRDSAADSGTEKEQPGAMIKIDSQEGR